MLHSPCLCLVLCMLAVCVHHVIVPRQRAMFLYILLMHLHSPSSEFTIKHTCIACYSLTEAMCSCVSVSQVNIHCFCIFTASHWCTFECSTLVIHSTRVASWRIGCEQVRSKFVCLILKSQQCYGGRHGEKLNTSLQSLLKPLLCSVIFCWPHTQHAACDILTV